jgi:hypothetical protein
VRTDPHLRMLTTRVDLLTDHPKMLAISANHSGNSHNSMPKKQGVFSCLKITQSSIFGFSLPRQSA